MGDFGQSKCELCFIYGVWSRYANHIRLHNPQFQQRGKSAALQIDETRLDRAWEMAYVDFTKLLPHYNLLLKQSEAKPFVEQPFAV